MAKGGRRAGAGRKPGRSVGVVLGLDGARRVRGAELPPAVPIEDRQVLQDPPSDLPEAAQVCWKAWAARAVGERTLTPATVPGFRQLCLLMAMVQAIDDRIAVLGVATQDALPYLAARRAQAAQLAASLKDFRLTAFGKPMTSEKPKVGVNPFAQVAG